MTHFVLSQNNRFAKGNVGQRTLGNWELGRCIGEGEWTQVFIARPVDSEEERPWDFAVKIAKQNAPQVSRLIQREALVGKIQSHPNVISVFSAQLDRSPLHIVTPFLEGAPLHHVTRLGLHVPPQHAIWVVRQIAQGLRSLHSCGWRHGDVKPENIIVGASGHTTLIDLGFCRRLDQQAPEDRDPLALSWAYAAPELFCTSYAVKGAADIYSLGVVLFELLTANLPFRGSSAAELATQHLRAAPPALRSLDAKLPVQLDWLLKRMLAKDPLRRPTEDELIGELSALEIDLLPRLNSSSFNSNSLN